MLFIVILVAFRFAWIIYHQPVEQPLVEEGYLDLSDWTFDDQETVYLTGEWEFYPEQFLKTDRKDDNRNSSNLIRVPGDWQPAFNNPASSHAFGYGSYRLTIALPEVRPDSFGIRVNSLHTDARIIVNGTEVKTVNTPAQDFEVDATFRGPFLVTFYVDANDSEVELVIEASNYQVPFMGGLNKHVTFGTEAAITHETNMLQFLQMSVIIILFLHAIYAFLLYFIGKGKVKKELLYFSLLLLLMGLGNLLDDEIFLQIPVNGEVAFRIMIAIYVSILLIMIYFIHEMYRTPKRFIYVITFVLVVMLVLTLLVLPFQYFIPLLFIYFICYFIAISYMIVTTMQYIHKGDVNGFFILFFIFSYTSNIVWGFLGMTDTLLFPFYPFDFLISILSIALLLFRRHIEVVELSEKQANKLREENKKKDEFLANTSHEIRNPLHGMINMAQTVLNNQGSSLDKDAQYNLNLLIRVGHQLTYTLNDILDITKLNDRHIDIERVEVDVREISNRAVEVVQFMALDEKVKIINDIPMDFPKIAGDFNRLLRVFFNLLDNAMKFTEEGTIRLSSTADDTTAHIFVADTGIGMTEEEQERVFIPYEKLSKTKSGSGGIGLGLNICRQLIELHGGKLSVVSEAGVGTTFSFSIPLATDDTAKIEKTEESQLIKSINLPIDVEVGNERREKPCVLIVDDDPVNLRVMQNLLASKYHLYLTVSPIEALQQINMHQFDLVISDVMMPDMSGYKLTEKIRRSYSLSELPVLLLTAKNQPEDIYTGFLSGANDYIAKPVDALELETRTRALIDLKRSVHAQLQMEAAWLQAQIKPHFIFNTLNTIASLSTSDVNAMIDLLQTFGKYLSSSFNMKNTQLLVPLEDELELVETYLSINKVRFKDRVTYRINCDDAAFVKVPPLSIQTLVENSLSHGILLKESGGEINIEGQRVNGKYMLRIIDDGVGMSEAKINEILQEDEERGIGLYNTHVRLKKLYGKGLKIESEENKGTIIVMELPISE